MQDIITVILLIKVTHASNLTDGFVNDNTSGNDNAYDAMGTKLYKRAVQPAV